MFNASRKLIVLLTQTAPIAILRPFGLKGKRLKEDGQLIECDSNAPFLKVAAMLQAVVVALAAIDLQTFMTVAYGIDLLAENYPKMHSQIASTMYRLARYRNEDATLTGYLALHFSERPQRLNKKKLRRKYYANKKAS
jgi:hypothetical protein